MTRWAEDRSTLTAVLVDRAPGDVPTLLGLHALAVAQFDAAQRAAAPVREDVGTLAGPAGELHRFVTVLR